MLTPEQTKLLVDCQVGQFHLAAAIRDTIAEAFPPGSDIYWQWSADCGVSGGTVAGHSAISQKTRVLNDATGNHLWVGWDKIIPAPETGNDAKIVTLGHLIARQRKEGGAA